MNKAYEIQGQPIIEGTINIQGSKNSSLAIVIASLLSKDVVCLKNVPNIKDIQELLSILKYLNCDITFQNNELTIDSTNIKYKSLLFDEIRKFRASYYFIGVFLSLYKKVEIYLPGGCKIGKRPIDQHIKGLNALNVDLCINNDILKANAINMKGGQINLDIASVGATINIILASIFSNSCTIIKNAAKEPEITDLVNFLNKMGANIIGAGSSVILINPVKQLYKVNYTVMSDRIVTGTYLIYGVLFAKKLTLKNIKTDDNLSLINTLISIGAQMDIKDNEITIYKTNNLKSANIITTTFPGFPSDLQQIITILLFASKKVSIIEETLFENRFSFLNEIAKMNGKFLLIENKAIIMPSKLTSTTISCNDLRGGAALLLACMMADSKSVLKNVEYIERGYENIVEVLRSVNVNIKEIDLNET